MAISFILMPGMVVLRGLSTSMQCWAIHALRFNALTENEEAETDDRLVNGLR